MSMVHAPVLFKEDVSLDLPRQFDDIERELQSLLALELPSEDGIPMETNWHRIQMNLLIDSIHALWRDRADYFAGGNMFIYFSVEQVRHKDYRGPDIFVVKDVDGTRDRDSWIVWNEDGRYPDVIVELASPSTIRTDLHAKKRLYAQTFRTPDYFCYDPNDKHVWGWHLGNSHYVDLAANERGWLWSKELNAWFGLWDGEFQRVRATWLRLYAPDGELVLTFAEAERLRAEIEHERAEAESQRADRLAAKLQELGIAPEAVLTSS